MPTGVPSDVATSIFNLPYYRVIAATVLDDGRRRGIVQTDQPPGCPAAVSWHRGGGTTLPLDPGHPCRRRSGGVWSKFRCYCGEPECARLSSFESTAQVPRHARSTGRRRNHVADAVIRSGRTGSKTVVEVGVSWWMVRAALNEACLLKLPDVDGLGPLRLGIDEHRFRSVRFFFRDPESTRLIRQEPWMTTIVDLDTGQILGMVDGQDHKGAGGGSSPVPWTGDWASKSWLSTPRLRSAKRYGCGSHAPQSQSIISSQSPWPTRP